MKGNSVPAKDDIEGLWSTADNTEQYAILKDQSKVNQYVAITIKNPDSARLPGMVKVEFYNYDSRQKLYRGLYYQKNLGAVLNGFTVKNNKIEHWFGHAWYRMDKSGHRLDQEIESEESVRFKVLNKDFVYLKLGKLYL